MSDSDIDAVGAKWLVGLVDSVVILRDLLSPSEFSEKFRYLPGAVTSIPGPMRFEVNPYMREIVDCFDIDSPVREVNLKKGVQITYTTALESGLLYFMAHIGTYPMMFVSADKELVKVRVENNILPMLEHSGFSQIVKSLDTGNSRKTGKNKDGIQIDRGGFLIPGGAKNADKMRSHSILLMLKDEIDAWPDTVGRDGDPDALTDARCSAYWSRRKIFRGSTPLFKGSSKIEAAFRRGDRRVYKVLCRVCGFPQALRWSTTNEKNGVVGGFKWETVNGTLQLDSVCYMCSECGAEHFEHHKKDLFDPEHGAAWHPTAEPVEPGIRSYHLPALYSPIGMQPWSKCVADYLNAYDDDAKRVKDVGKYQVFYNNILGEPFEVIGARVSMRAVSAHRRTCYEFGQIPNSYALRVTGAKVSMLVCTVDVHGEFLSVAVFGFCQGLRCFLIDYWTWKVEKGEDCDCSSLDASPWQKVRDLIDGRVYVADDGRKYRIALTLIDSSYSADTVTSFCVDYEMGVVPIMGRARTAKFQRINEFGTFETKLGTVGSFITVDHYKDRLAMALRREWVQESGHQPVYHFNVPQDCSDSQLKELTAEKKVEKVIEGSGIKTYEWQRRGRNELWDLLVYAHAAVEMLAADLCIEKWGRQNVSWPDFWEYAEAEKIYFDDNDDVA